MPDRLSCWWLNLHAIGRRVDADQALLGALGVAAFAYPHQIENVRRMATETSCRWLLADEVGLGKTVQALMLLRALGAQRETGLRVALITPDDLVQQWQEELLCRTHVGAAGIALEPSDDTSPPPPKRGQISVDLCRPARLAAGAIRLTARLYDVLLVDEYPKLTQQVRDMVGVASRSIPHVLLLSATPGMHDPQTRRDILSVLEPDLARRAAALGGDVLELLQARESEAIARLRGDSTEPVGQETPAGRSREFYAATHAMFRRVIRTRRADFPDALPQRRFFKIVVPPTDGDVERVNCARRYLASATAEGLNVRQDLLLQIASRSPPSLINRVSTLRRHGASLAAILKQLEEAARDPGDAKLDALIDHLQEIFRETPDARILVVAEDNRSVDYLATAIEKLVEVPVSRKRRAYGDAEVELDVHVAQLRDELEAFEAGNSRVLVAADVAAEGHNLQFASHIIFYVLPWDPRDVDQWIGRLDRLGGKGPPGRRTITVTAIVTEGSIEAKILEVYEAAHIFSGGRVFDEEAWRKLGDAIDAAAYGSGGDWGAVVQRAGQEAAEEEGWRGYSHFPASERAELARGRFNELRERRYALPVSDATSEGRRNWFIEREVAARRLLAVAEELDVLKLRKKTDHETGQVYRTVWYARQPQPGDIVVPELDTAHSGFHAAVLLKRSDLRSPPNANVGRRRLHFFDHGDPLHESIVSAFAALPAPSSIQTEHLVRFPDDHPGAKFRGSRILLVSAELHPAFGAAFSAEALLSYPSAGDSQPERDAMQSAVRRAYEEYLADLRWFTDLAQPKFYLMAGRLGATGIETIAPTLFAGLQDGLTLPQRLNSRALVSSAVDQVRSVQSVLRERLGEQARRDLTCCRESLASELELRLFAADAEARDHVAAAMAVEREGTQRGGNQAFDRARRRANELAVLLAELGRELRRERLQGLSQAISRTQIEPRYCLLSVQ